MNCPNCGLINPPSAQRCDCGYEFLIQTEELGSEDRTDGPDAGQAFVNRYFDSPEPQRAPTALRAFLKTPVAQDRNNVTWYLFARIAQDHPWLVREYEPLLREIPEGRTALLLILWQCGDDGTKAVLEACQSDSEFAPICDQIVHVLQNWKPGRLSPLERPTESCADLDLLWCEFRATGNLAAVARIIDVLEQADIVRGKLGNWLRESPHGTVATLCGELFRQASILCDSESREVLSPQDLDCHCMLEELNFSKPRFDMLSALLPFSMSEDAQRMMVKASAKWSLASHAQQFPQILELCKSESEKRTGRCRLTLLEILARLALRNEDYGMAFGTLMEAITLDPKQREEKRKTAEEEWERLQALSQEEAELSSGTGPSAQDSAALCVKATQQAQALWAKRYERKAGHREIGPGDATWECEFERPGKFRVFQRMWLNREVVGDEWITVAGVNFRGPVYVAGPNPSEAINRAVVPDVYLQLLRKKPVEFGTYTFRGRQYLRFEYKNVPRPGQGLLGQVLAFTGVSWFRCDAVAWMDSETSRLVKVVLALNAHSNPGIPDEEVGLYCYFDQPMAIVAPPFQITRARLSAA